MAASLLVNGQIFSQTSFGGEGRPDLHHAVLDFFDALPAEHREYFVGLCAESALVSDQLWGLDRQRVGGGTTTLDQSAYHFAARRWAWTVPSETEGVSTPGAELKVEMCAPRNVTAPLSSVSCAVRTGHLAKAPATVELCLAAGAGASVGRIRTALQACSEDLARQARHLSP
ncbi:YwqJ-related putative deaminase [Streptomyces sp. NPDC002793]|uniref:YwqJ-related putative deaminase n=1 Tax=Streptomyces sp. NPDC002793 TaxID=3154432 RepID=UPI003333F608